MSFSRLRIAFGVLLIILLTLWSGWVLLPPKPLSVDANPSLFSAERALAHIEVIAAQQRIPGTAYHRQAQEYLLDQFQSLGLEAHIQHETYITPNRSYVPFKTAQVSNIIARIRGQDSTGAIILVAHYDSVTSGPGAGDDALGVAAVLETARVLSSEARPKNDVIFLLSDGHEYGLYGARAFVESHPWAEDVALIFNFEAQGPRGPVYMFETSRDNRWLVRNFAQAIPRAMTDSFSYDVYQMLNFDNDFRIFMDHGYTGLGFAAITDLAYYHSELDSLDRLNLRTLQHQGSYALALGRHFSQLDLRSVNDETSSVYFNFGRLLIHYPSGWAMPLALLAALLAILVLTGGLIQGKLSFKLFTGFGLQGIILGVGLALVGLLSAGLELNAYTYRSPVFFTGFLLMGLAMAFIGFLILKNLQAKDWAAAAMVWWTIAALTAAVLTPNGSHIFVWPLFSLTLGMAAILVGKVDPHRQWLAITAGALPGLLLLAPLVWMVFIALTLDMAVASIGLLLLVIMLMMPVLQPLTLWGQRRLAIALALGTVAVLLWAGLGGYNEAYPQHYDLIYVQDMVSDEALWASSDSSPHPWVQNYTGKSQPSPLPQVFPYSGTYYYNRPTESLNLTPPGAEVLDDATELGVRTLNLRLTSPRGGHTITVYLERGTPIISTSLNGKPVTQRFEADWIWAVEVLGIGEEGIELEFQVPIDQPVNILVVDQAQDAPVRDRPASLIMRPMWPYRSNGTFVAVRYSFE